MDISDRCAIVTGASTGIGRATAKALSNEGVRVVLAARSASTLETVADEIEAAGGETLVHTTDVSDREQVKSLIEAARDTFGDIDIMVNNAGVGHWKREGIVAGDLDEWEQEFNVNLVGVMYGTRLAAQVMTDQGMGDIVNVGSGSGRIASPQWPSYVASKFGVTGFSQSARRDLRDAGVRVTLIEPGEVATPIQPQEDIESRRMLHPEDVADAIVYAVSRPDRVCVDDIQIGPSGRT